MVRYADHWLLLIEIKFLDLESGKTVVDDTGWGHLQIDATSLYLLTLAQMTTSGTITVVYFYGFQQCLLELYLKV